jgi:hypothetical protein
VGVLLQAVRDERYPIDEWAFFAEVRNTTGASGDVLRFADAIAGVPLVPVARTLPDGGVVLACNHVVDRPPLAKVRKGQGPAMVPCVYCGEEQKPATPAAVHARIAKATPDELRVYLRAVQERLAAEPQRGAA